MTQAGNEVALCSLRLVSVIVRAVASGYRFMGVICGSKVITGLPCPTSPMVIG